jgi:hypothetical protein
MNAEGDITRYIGMRSRRLHQIGTFADEVLSLIEVD